MSDELLMIPPQIQVGKGLHTLQVGIVSSDGSDRRLITLNPAGEKFSYSAPAEKSSRLFTPDEFGLVMPWLAEASVAIGGAMDRKSQMELRRAGYKV